jgi:very-short-patch-repair endonuclease
VPKISYPILYNYLKENYEVEIEYKFCPTRRWRFDFAIPSVKLAIEIEGGTWIYGRHNRASSIHLDFEKYNNAARLGWRLLRFIPAQLKEKKTYDLIDKTIKANL